MALNNKGISNVVEVIDANMTSPCEQMITPPPELARLTKAEGLKRLKSHYSRN